MKLVIEDTIDNVATLQDCSVDQVESRSSTREALQLLGEDRFQLTAWYKTHAAMLNLNTIMWTVLFYSEHAETF